MEPAIATPPSPPQPPGAVEPAAAEPRVSAFRRRGRPPVHLVLLAGILLLSLGLRLWGIKQGLPYSYNSDEATHFVSRAVGFTGGDFNPHYFLNPAAYTDLLYVVLVVWFGGGGELHHVFSSDPSAVYVVARVVAAVLGTVSVWLTYVAGARLFGRWAGLLAAAALGLAFLPVFYSHLALNDAPTLAPVALSLVGVAGIVSRRGAPRPSVDYALAGLGIGLSAATKYTGGIMLLCLLAAGGFDAASRSGGQALRRLAGGLGVAFAAFVIADPYAIIDHSAFFSGLSYQAGAVGTAKLGTDPTNGWIYYLWTFTWGLGWLPAMAGVAGGALLLWRRRIPEALVLLPPIAAYLLYMGAQERFFGRWLMPIFPLVALLAGFAGAELVRHAGRGRRLATWMAGTGIVVLLAGQSMAADVHDDLVLSRPDTRNLARAWMISHIPAGAKVVIEPIVPADWSGRWHRFPTWLAHLPGGSTKPIHIDQYESYLSPGLVATYTTEGYCWVVTGSQQSGRAFVAPDKARGAVAYYAALARQGSLVYRVSPYTPGSGPPRFNYDWAFDYYPGQYRQPGPRIAIYHLRGGGCGRG